MMKIFSRYVVTVVSIFALGFYMPVYAAFTQSYEGAPPGSHLFNSSVAGPTGDMTVESWVYFNNLPTNGNGFWLWFFNVDGTHRSFYTQVTNTAGTYKIHLGMYGNSSDTDTTWTPSPVTGTWYRVSLTYDNTSGDAIFRINGTSLGTTAQGSGGQISVTTRFDIGSRTAGDSDFDGDFSLVRFWSTIRTPTQLGADQCATLGATTGLLAEWSLDNTLSDSSGNSYTLTNTSGSFVSRVPTCSAASTALNRGTTTLFGWE